MQNIASHWNCLYFYQYCTDTVQYCCSVSKEKHDQVFSAALLNGHKIQISLQLPDPDLTWRVASTAHWTLRSNPTLTTLLLWESSVLFIKVIQGASFSYVNDVEVIDAFTKFHSNGHPIWKKMELYDVSAHKIFYHSFQFIISIHTGWVI